MLTLLRSVAKAGIQSASIMTIADIGTQLVVENRSFITHEEKGICKDTHQASCVTATSSSSSSIDYDPIRTLRWTIVGLTLHGPYFFLAFGKLDRLFSTPTFANAFKKTAITQLTIFPPYLVALFSFLNVLERHGSDGKKTSNNNDIIPKVQQAFKVGCIFWPIANSINFSFISPQRRIPYLATVGGIWNGYLSYMNANNSE